MSITLARCDAADILNLRHRILRAGLPRETASFDGDDDPATAHFAAQQGERIVGCVSVMRRAYDGREAWQLRGMAVDAGMQRAGVGAMLLGAAELHVRESGVPLIWCNARELAVGFYRRHGWMVVSERFEFPTAGPHFRMTREL